MGQIAPYRVAHVDNRDGWELEIRRYGDPSSIAPGRNPIALIPGYAMNSYILGFHPSGPSMVEHLVGAGFEVWTANLRGQGGSRPTGTPARYGLGELALVDLPRVFDHILEETATGAERVDPIGCSLGGSLVYAWLAHHPVDHRCGRVVAIGGPLRWDHVSPLLRGAFVSGHLAGAVPIVGTRRMAALALPVLKRIPGALSMYMNVDGIDLANIGSLVQTVDDPVPYINRQLARWIRDRDLRVRGVDVLAGLRNVEDAQFLAILANRDGIVPPSAARSIVGAVGEARATVLEIGTEANWYAHADLFIGRSAVRDVFEPLERWLLLD